MKPKPTPKIRIHIKPGLDVFVNSPEEVKKVKAKYAAHAIIVKPSLDMSYGFKETK